MLESTYPMRQSSYCDIPDKDDESKTGSDSKTLLEKRKSHASWNMYEYPAQNTTNIARRRGTKNKICALIYWHLYRNSNVRWRVDLCDKKGQKENVARARIFIEPGLKQFTETIEIRSVGREQHCRVSYQHSLTHHRDFLMSHRQIYLLPRLSPWRSRFRTN